MKFKALFVFCVLLLSSGLLFSQSVKVQTAETGVETYDLPTLSKVVNNQVFVATFSDNKATIIGFETGTLKQTVKFTTEKTKFIVKNGVQFLENRIVVIYENNGAFMDVFDYKGKLIAQKLPLSNLTHDDSWNGFCEVSENAKYLMVAHPVKNYYSPINFVVYDAEMKLVNKGSIKLPKGFEKSRIEQMVLSNKGEIAVLASSDEESMNIGLFKYTPASKAVEMIKELSNNHYILNSKIIVNKKGIYVGGIYGDYYDSDKKVDGMNRVRSIDGAFGVKLNVDDFSLIYDYFSPFKEDQAEAYNAEMKKHPNYSKGFEKTSSPDGKIINEYLQNHLDGMSVDRNDNIAMAISSYHGIADNNTFATNIIIAQFKLTKDGVSDFKVIPKRHTVYNDPMEDGFRVSEYFFSALFCNGDKMISIFNEDEKNLDNVSDMNKNISAANKKSLLADVETKEDGKLKKYKLLPGDEDVLILTGTVLYVDETTMYAIATRDKDAVVLLKFTAQ